MVVAVAVAVVPVDAVRDGPAGDEREEPPGAAVAHRQGPGALHQAITFKYPTPHIATTSN